MQLPSVSALAKWPKPNYVNPETRGPGLLITNCVMLSVSLVVIGIRIYTRVWISNNFGWDDVFILLALTWIFGVAAMAALTFANFGGSRHIWDVVPSTVPELLKYSLATQLVFGQAVTFIKVSMLLLTKRIMGNGSKTIRNIIIFGIIYVVAGNISYTIVMIFQCKPISAQWTLSFKPQDCINERAHIISASVINVVSDFLVVLIPIPVVLKLKMRSRQRAVVIALFAAGFAVCIVGTVRTIYASILTDPNRTDFTWDAYPVYISGAVEMYVGLICASIPPTRAFFSIYTPKLLSITTGTGTRADKNTYDSTTSRSKRFLSRSNGGDDEKGIPMSDFATSSKSHYDASHDKNNSIKPRDGEIRVTVGVNISRKDSLGSDFETSSVDDLDRSKQSMPKVKQWRGGVGPRGGEPSMNRVESQTNLIAGQGGR